MKFVAFFFAFALLLIVGHEIYRVYRAFEISRPIIASAVPYTQRGSGARVLFAGESTGVGTGARVPEESVAGLLGRDLPDAEIKNISRNGSRMSELHSALSSLSEEKFDMIVLQIGGNDILNFTSPASVRTELRGVLSEATKRSAHVYLMTTGDVGNAPAFGPLLSRLYTARTNELVPMFKEESKKTGVVYVDLFEPRETDPFFLEPLKYHAADGVHPSSDGYAIWYGKLRSSMK
jgi:lysophospholipase L1-like esterase